VQRILEAHQLAPHRIRTFKLSNDPKFAEKLKDIVGLYVDPPAHAVVLSVDEKSQIQALDRTQPGLPMKPGRARTMTHDYKRHGTTTLFAALNVLDGTVIGQNMKRHRHQEFIRFLNAIEARVPKRKAIHAVVDNYATHKHPKVRQWLARHPRWTFHFTPISASWLNAVEDILRQAHQKATHSRRLPIRPRSQGRHQPLRLGNQCQTKTLHLDRRPQPRPRRCQTRETSVRVDPLGCGAYKEPGSSRLSERRLVVGGSGKASASASSVPQCIPAGERLSRPIATGPQLSSPYRRLV